MDGRELSSKLNYFGQERCARRILLEDGLATAEQVALMTREEVCGKLLEKYAVVAVESEEISLIDRGFLEEYNAHLKTLYR